MLANAIEGVVENGRIRLDEGVSLPENTRVYVVVADQPKGRTLHIRSPRLVHPEQADSLRKKVVELPPDAKI